MANYRSGKGSSRKKDSIPGNISTIIFSFFWICATASFESPILVLIGLFFLIRSIARLAKLVSKDGKQRKSDPYPLCKPASSSVSRPTQTNPVTRPTQNYSASRPTQSRPTPRPTSYTAPQVHVSQNRPATAPKTYNPYTVKEVRRRCRYCRYPLWPDIPDCPNCGKKG